MRAISVLQLVKRFNGVQALAGLDLDVAEGELFAFLGPNGAGKTTTVRILVTLLAPTAGAARVCGFDMVDEPDRVRQVIGVALQEAGLDPLATGREWLSLQGRLHGLRGRTLARRVDELLELVGLAAEAAGRRVGTYSGGMQRRLDLASALVHAPRVLFLDEPTTGLDPVSRQAVWDEIVRLNRVEGATVFLTTQYLEEADRLAERVAIIDDGRLVAEGAPDSLKAEIAVDVLHLALAGPAVERAAAALADLDGLEGLGREEAGLTVFVTAGARALPDVLRRLDRAGVDVEAASLARPSLDEVFLRATGHRLQTDQPAPDAAAT